MCNEQVFGRYSAPKWSLKTSATLFLYSIFVAQTALACYKEILGGRDQYDIVCECNATHCDSLEFNWPQDDISFTVVESNRAGKRFNKTQVTPCNDYQSVFDLEISINRTESRQEIIGYGGAFTDSASRLILDLGAPVRRKLLDDYFGSNGLDYNMGRVPISGTDMSTHPYSYDDLRDGEEDLNLDKFHLQKEDFLFKIPLITRVNDMRASRNLEPLKLTAASWSPPAWMKTNNNLVQGHLKGGPYYDAYSRYLIRFLEEYERHDIAMWALTPQNEPYTPSIQPINFNSVNYSPEEMGKLLENSLIPHLIAANRTKDKLQLLVWDDIMVNLENYMSPLTTGKLVSEHVSGLCYHWYTHGLSNTSYQDIYDLRRDLPTSFSMMSTESSFIGKPEPGNWTRAEKYAKDIIENWSAGAVTYLDWNLALDMSGGPTWVNNYLDAAILIDREKQLYYKNPMYYAIAHLSRFIAPNSRIIKTVVTPQTAKIDNQQVKFVAAELEGSVTTKDGEERSRMAMVALNEKSSSVNIKLNLPNCPAKTGQTPLTLKLEANSITSLAFTC